MGDEMMPDESSGPGDQHSLCNPHKLSSLLPSVVRFLGPMRVHRAPREIHRDIWSYDGTRLISCYFTLYFSLSRASFGKSQIKAQPMLLQSGVPTIRAGIPRSRPEPHDFSLCDNCCSIVGCRAAVRNFVQI